MLSIAAPSAIFRQPHAKRNRMNPAANRGTETTTTTYLKRVFRRQLPWVVCFSATNAVTEPNCFARSSSCAVVWAGKPQLAQVSVPPGELRSQYWQTHVYIGAD